MGVLNDRERKFVESYCSDAKFNGSQAAINAGYSAKTARVKASQLLTKVNIQEAVENFMNKATEKALCTTEMVVRGLLLEAKCNGEGSSQSARVSAWKALTDYTGGFDNNKQKIESTVSVTKADDNEW